MVLPVHVGELRLEEDVLPLETPGREGVGECLSDSSFDVVAALIGRVDPAKTGIDRHAHQPGGVVFLPRRAVDQPRHPDVMHSSVWSQSALLLLAKRPLPFLLVHLGTEARALAQIAIEPSLREVFFVRLRGRVFFGGRVPDLHAQGLLHQTHVVHPHRIVVREQGADLDADVAPDTLLKTVLYRLAVLAPPHRPRTEILDAADGTELGALTAGKAEIHVHEGDFAWTLLLLAPFVWPEGLGDPLFFQPPLDGIYIGHAVNPSRA